MGKFTLADRMKNFYENRIKQKLVRKTNFVIRLDGRSFSKYCKKLEKPFDYGFVEDMQKTAKYLAENIQGCKFVYVQSDEISVWITDYDSYETDLLFDGEVQKITSITASLATAKFNQLRLLRDLKQNPNMDIEKDQKLVEFDSRILVIPDIEEVVNCFIWRQQDCTRNSIAMAAQENFPQKQLSGKNINQQQEMLFQVGINWNDYPTSVKRGSIVYKTEENGKTFWKIDEAPIFSKNKEIIKNIYDKIINSL